MTPKCAAPGAAIGGTRVAPIIASYGGARRACQHRDPARHSAPSRRPARQISMCTWSAAWRLAPRSSSPRPSSRTTSKSRRQPSFRRWGIEIVRGRAFTEEDSAEGRQVLIVNESAATLAWPHKDAVGERMRVADTWATVVGVAADTRIESSRPFGNGLPAAGAGRGRARAFSPSARRVTRSRSPPRFVAPARRCGQV